MRLPQIRHYFLVVSVLLIADSSISQTIPNQHDRFHSFPSFTEDLSIKDLYNVEYKLVDEAHLGDSTILLQLNPLTLEYFRKDTKDFVLNYKGLNIDILIFSRERIAEKKRDNRHSETH